MPDHETIRNNPQLNKIFGTLLHDPNLLHLNRRSVSGAFYIGLFMALVPMPFQMVPAAALAILFRTNLPISIGLVWVSNPFTMPPLFYFCYKLGAWLLNTPLQAMNFELSWEWLSTELGAIWQPFLLGCLLVGIVLAMLGGLSIRLLWRLNVVRQWQERQRRRNARKGQNQT